MARRNKPKTPEQIQAERLIRRARELEAVNVQPESAALPTSEDIEVTRKGQKRGDQKADRDGARRLDAFSALKDGMAPGAYDAVRRFEADICTRRGESDKGPSGERVDRTAGLVTDAMLMAAERIEAVVARLPPRDWWLLMELISPRKDWGGWRNTVAYITGETHQHAQGAAVRAACVNLRDAYEAMERRAAA